MAENKTKATESSVADYLAAIEDEGRRKDCAELCELMAKATKQPPKMWGTSIVGFGDHHYRYESGREGDMPLVGFSPRKAATVLYGLMGSGESEALVVKLGKHTTGKGCLYIKKLGDVDQEVLKALVVKALSSKRAQHAAK